MQRCALSTLVPLIGTLGEIRRKNWRAGSKLTCRCDDGAFRLQSLKAGGLVSHMRVRDLQ